MSAISLQDWKLEKEITKGYGWPSPEFTTKLNWLEKFAYFYDRVLETLIYESM